MKMHDHAWEYLVEMCKRERERLTATEFGMGQMLQEMAAWDSLNEIECMIPPEHWPDHESRDEGPVEEMAITVSSDRSTTSPQRPETTSTPDRA
jgi:hypothetical protein